MVGCYGRADLLPNFGRMRRIRFRARRTRRGASFLATVALNLA